MNTVFPYRAGDVIKVSQKVVEGEKERIVPFMGKIVDVKGSGKNTMFTVRREIEGIEVDRIFPYYTPTIQKIELVEKPKKRVRRANLLHKRGS